MLTLYSAPTSNGLRASIAIEELEFSYELKKVDLEGGEQRSPEFLALNPFGQIPVLVDDDGSDGAPLVVNQSGAIMSYLAEKAGKMLPTTAAERFRFRPVYLSILTDASLTLGTIFTIMRASEPHQPSIDMFSARMAAIMQVYDGWLAERPFIAGEAYTVADIGLFGVVYRMRQVVPAILDGLGNVARWTDEIEARPGVQRGIASLA